MQIILTNDELKQILQERFKRYGQITELEVTHYENSIKVTLKDTKVPKFEGEPLPITT